MKNNEFIGKNLVFTGASVIKRDYLFGLAQAIGANPQKGINKQTNLLIVGEKPGNKKLGMAEKYEIPQVEDYQFVKAIKNQYPSMSPEEILDEMFAY
jgi:NAD-dependent DNA ligase